MHIKAIQRIKQEVKNNIPKNIKRYLFRKNLLRDLFNRSYASAELREIILLYYFNSVKSTDGCELTID